jgi:hypothetical protein
MSANPLRLPGLPIRNQTAIMNAVSMFSKTKHAPYRPHTQYHQIPQQQSRDIEMVPLVSQDDTPTGIDQAQAIQCCCCCSRMLILVIFRTILPLGVLMLVFATNNANNHAVHVWHTEDLQRRCDEARGLTAGTGTPSSLPAWLGANGGWHPLEWIIVCILFYIVFVAAIIILSVQQRRQTHATKGGMCFYPRSSSRILLITAIVLFLSTALLVAIIQMVILLVAGIWEIPWCADAVKTPWLRASQPCFPVIPVLILFLLVLEIWAFKYTVHV